MKVFFSDLLISNLYDLDATKKKTEIKPQQHKPHLAEFM